MTPPLSTTLKEGFVIAEVAKPKLLPRETGHDIGMGSPIGLSLEAVGVITRLRNMKVTFFVPKSCTLNFEHFRNDCSVRMKMKIGAAGEMLSFAPRVPFRLAP